MTSRFSAASRLLAFVGGGAHMEGILARLGTPQGDQHRGFQTAYVFDLLRLTISNF